MTDDPKYCNEDVAKKVLYEFAMFTFLCDKLKCEYWESNNFAPGDITYLGTGWDANEDRRTQFALLESLLIHTRILRDFFYKPATHDDIVASHFVPDWSSLRPPQNEYLSVRRDRFDKAIAHLSLKRIEYESNEKKWNLDAIRDSIEKPMKKFLETLSPDRVSWFKT